MRVIVHAGESFKSNPRRYMQITGSQWLQLIPSSPQDEEQERWGTAMTKLSLAVAASASR